MQKIFILIAFAFSCLALPAQLPYTTSQYAYDSVMNHVYGTAVDYAGNVDTLLMDIYKPKGDSNCHRPVMVMVHGGAWIAGSKEDANMVYMTRELAKRGWVVANINYRLGVHTAANHTMYAFCNPNIAAPCGYIADSSEMIRALYRGMQDTKGAIRYMKSRNVMDSTDINNVYIAGESAGAFNVMAAAFTDQISEKHPACDSIADAPVPDSDMASYGCIPTPISRTRPDLGSLEGDLHLGTYDASVDGVGSFYGGVLDTMVFQQAFMSPTVYMFHQGSDVVVHYNRGRLLGRLSYECYGAVNLCQPYYFYPIAYGNEAVRRHFVNLGATSPVFHADIVNNYSYNNNCQDNGHSIDNRPLRFQTMVDLFADRIAFNGNTPNSNCMVAVDPAIESPVFSLYPNPSHEKVTIETDRPNNQGDFQVVDIFGRTMVTGKMSGPRTVLDLHEFESGIYFLRIVSSGQTLKFVKN
jgi:acetyl esterase/lipase